MRLQLRRLLQELVRLADPAGAAAFDELTALVQTNADHGIRTAVYGTLGEPIAMPELLRSDLLTSIAMQHGRTVEEVALRRKAGAALADYLAHGEPPWRALSAASEFLYKGGIITPEEVKGRFGTMRGLLLQPGGSLRPGIRGGLRGATPSRWR